MSKEPENKPGRYGVLILLLIVFGAIIVCGVVFLYALGDGLARNR